MWTLPAPRLWQWPNWHALNNDYLKNDYLKNTNVKTVKSGSKYEFNRADCVVCTVGNRACAAKTARQFVGVKSAAAVVTAIWHFKRSALHLPMGRHADFILLYRRRRARMVWHWLITTTCDARSCFIAHIFCLRDFLCAFYPKACLKLPSLVYNLV